MRKYTVEEVYDKELRKEICQYAKQSGKDVDGDLVRYDDGLYYIHIINDIILQYDKITIPDHIINIITLIEYYFLLIFSIPVVGMCIFDICNVVQYDHANCPLAVADAIGVCIICITSKITHSYLLSHRIFPIYIFPNMDTPKKAYVSALISTIGFYGTLISYIVMATIIIFNIITKGFGVGVVNNLFIGVMINRLFTSITFFGYSMCPDATGVTFATYHDIDFMKYMKRVYKKVD